MNEQPRTEGSEGAPGSGGAARDATFLQFVHDTFSHDFCEGASALLADNDDLAPARPEVSRLPEQADDVQHEAARAAALRRHPSTYRRF